MVDEKIVLDLVEWTHKGLGEVFLTDSTNNPYQLRLKVLLGDDFVLELLFKFGKQKSLLIAVEAIRNGKKQFDFAFLEDIMHNPHWVGKGVFRSKTLFRLGVNSAAVLWGKITAQRASGEKGLWIKNLCKMDCSKNSLSSCKLSNYVSLRIFTNSTFRK